jgi:hypothetical protein
VAAVLEREQVASAVSSDTPRDRDRDRTDDRDPGSLVARGMDTKPDKTDAKPDKTDAKPDKTDPRTDARADVKPDKTDVKPDKTDVKPDKTDVKPDKPDRSDDEGGVATLRIVAKPSCAVFINGKDTGKFTPVRDLEVPAGTVSITLVNNEYNIREKFSVTVKAGAIETVKKDFMDRVNAP